MKMKKQVKTDAEIEQEQLAAEQSDNQEPQMNEDKTFNYTLPGDAKGRIRTTRRIDWDAILD